MSQNIGIIGLGFMGKVHFNTYAKIKGAKVTAIADVDARKRSGDWSGIGGNIGGAGGRQNLRGIHIYENAADLLKDPAVDIVDITLPTYLHARWAIRALKSGHHVICEKPMALKSAEAVTMIAAARAARRRLFIAQCIRFWPAYAKARELVLGKKFGKVISAVFTRVSPRPTWSWQRFLEDPRKSGACALDLHIHDADFLLYMLGQPCSVLSRAVKGAGGALDHITTFYNYAPGTLIQAEGAWEYNAGFPFSMAFRIALEKASLVFDAQGLRLCPAKGPAKPVAVAEGDGYYYELKHFVDCIRRNCASPVVPPESALRSVQLIEAEVKSARSGKIVRFK
ncbi:MAG: Gfo/Idh/MocA family oxidoreductase [Verrucomicrobia bacterium]|nr:Gfo/Idh/MocA family oxidoreductase [Verrucomicrobiota bacterium]MBU1735133.1 Gfo/Idh/MocA family oxidoreductase [Verrucomicrobiota bacterium]MBU1855990.1 Gfo/Idh/MocA family oxidoreductase [Verrucomicrobiota bacterium]